jgi:hypothetical protein
MLNILIIKIILFYLNSSNRYVTYFLCERLGVGSTSTVYSLNLIEQNRYQIEEQYVAKVFKSQDHFQVEKEIIGKLNTRITYWENVTFKLQDLKNKIS